MEETIRLTTEERNVIITALRTAPITGTLETLPQGMEKILNLIRKIQEASAHQGEEHQG